VTAAKLRAELEHAQKTSREYADANGREAYHPHLAGMLESLVKWAADEMKSDEQIATKRLMKKWRAA
jgi:hypothetical protein